MTLCWFQSSSVPISLLFFLSNSQRVDGSVPVIGPERGLHLSLWVCLSACVGFVRVFQLPTVKKKIIHEFGDRN